MKCYYHPKDDAVAVCKECGRGVCQQCTVIVSGNSYCKTCVETGRVKTPTTEIPASPVEAAVPIPLGVPSKGHFIVGAIGAIISGVAAILWLLGGVGDWLFVAGYYGFGFGSFWSIIGGIILGIGIILAGIGYLGIKRNYGLGTGTAGFALSIVACVFVFVTVAFAIIGVGYSYSYYYSYYSPWYAFYIISAVITLIMFGVTQIIWGIAHINSRRFTGNSGLALATGILLIISGALTASVIIAFIGIILFFVGAVLGLVIFLMSRIPEKTM